MVGHLDGRDDQLADARLGIDHDVVEVLPGQADQGRQVGGGRSLGRQDVLGRRRHVEVLLRPGQAAEEALLADRPGVDLAGEAGHRLVGIDPEQESGVAEEDVEVDDQDLPVALFRQDGSQHRGQGGATCSAPRGGDDQHLAVGGGSQGQEIDRLLGGLPHPDAQGPHDLVLEGSTEGLLAVHQLFVFLVGDHQDLAVLDRLGRARPGRGGVDDGHLPEEIAGPEGADQLGGHRQVADGDFHRSRDDDVQVARQVTFAEDDVAAPEFALLEDFLDLGEFLGRQVGEQGDLVEHGVMIG